MPAYKNLPYHGEYLFMVCNTASWVSITTHWAWNGDV